MNQDSSATQARTDGGNFPHSLRRHRVPTRSNTSLTNYLTEYSASQQQIKRPKRESNVHLPTNVQISISEK